MGLSKSTKSAWLSKLETYLAKYKSVILVCVDNVSSNQMHQIRLALRGKAEILMGKNTMARKILREASTSTDATLAQFEKLLPFIKGNVGFVFTNEDLKTIRDTLLSNKVAAPARAGAFAPNAVTVPAGNTGMEPGKTSFFQALGIPTKIARGTIEIVNDVPLIKAGDKVGPSEATLLNLLNISPFSYGMVVEQIYDQGNLFESSVLDISPDVLLERFTRGLNQITAIALAANHPTISSVGHTFLNSYKNIMSIALATDYEFDAVKQLKYMIANPDEFVAAASSTTAAAAPSTETAAPVAAKEEEKEESDEDMGFGLFD